MTIEEKILDKKEKIKKSKERIATEQEKIHKWSAEIEELESLEVKGLLKEYDIPISRLKDFLKEMPKLEKRELEKRESESKKINES